MTTVPTQKHSNIPLIGLGTWKLYGQECTDVVHLALDIGYRHIDTASLYENHTAIAPAIKPYPRRELFITSKLWIDDLKPEQIKENVPRFLEELQTDYLDLLLVHWPNPDLSLAESLKAMMECQEKGWVRAIGLSNCVRFHVKELESYHFPIVTNQIELHPYFQRKELVEVYQNAGIPLTAYRPLAKGAFESDPTLQEIGKAHEKTPSQVALRWAVQQDIVVIPKASSKMHLQENFEIFDFQLSEEEMKVIANLNRDERFCGPEGLPVYPD